MTEQIQYNQQYPASSPSMPPSYYMPPPQFTTPGYHQAWDTPMSFSALPLATWDRRPPSYSSSLQNPGTSHFNPGGATSYSGIFLIKKKIKRVVV